MKAYKKTIRRAAAAALAAVLLLCSAAPALADTFSAIVSGKAAVVYGDVSMSDKLGTLAPKSVVRVTGYSNTIAKISYKGHIGYMKISGLKRVEDVAEKAVANAAAPVYRAADTTSASVTVPAGTRLYVLARKGDWAQVEKGGVVAYMKTGYLEPADDDWSTASVIPTSGTGATPKPTQENGITVRTYSAVTTGELKVYKSASEKAKVKATLKAGAQVKVLATSSNGWAYIEQSGKHGYCRTELLREGVAESATPELAATPAASAGNEGVVSASVLNVYKKASTASAKLGTLKQGQAVKVLKWSGDWAQIEVDGKKGYCALAGLSKTGATVAPTATTPPSTANAKRATVTAKTLTIYDTASAKGKKLGTLKKGKTVNLLQTSDGWAFIELNGKYGYCKAKSLSVDKAQDGLPAGFKKAEFSATVITSDARAYFATSTDSESAVLKLGAEVQVVGYNKNWACVKQNGNYAFVAVKALSKARYAAISGDGTDLQTLLKALLAGGYYDGVPGTSYNTAAVAAIKRFQSACGMEQTGVADQNMLRIVYSGHAPVSSLLYKGLSSGDKSDSVSRVQARLYALGYLTRTASLDGEFGSTTVKAVKLFQTANGLTASGAADTFTLKAMYNTGAKRLPSGAKAADASPTATQPYTGTTYLNAVPNGLESTTTSYSSSMSNAAKLEYGIYLISGKLGCPYVYGATGPSKFDCSGLTVWMFKALDVSLKRSAYSQGYDNDYEKIEGWKNLERGDIVFFNTISDSDLSDHAGVYIGDGYFIHASSGAHKVVVSNLTTGYYGRVFSWGRRILK